MRRFEDERGWFMELMRASALPKPVRQSNLSRSRKGVIRGLHYHERGQDDLFVCLAGMVRVVVLNRETGETFTEDIGDENPTAIYVPGIHAHGFEALELFATRSHFDYHDEAARAQLAEWLSDTRLELHSVHAPAFEALRQGKWVGAFSNASADESRRRAAIAEAEAALALARLVPFQFLVTHIGVPSTEAAGGDNQRDAARRSHHSRIRQEGAATSPGAVVKPRIAIVNPAKTGEAPEPEIRSTPRIAPRAPDDDLASILSSISDDDIEEIFE